MLLVDPAGRVLLQRRAAVKTRFPLRWANACCGHPAPGEELAVAANRRLTEELGAAPVALTEVGVYVYHAEDPATGRVEYEYDHVLLGRVTGDERLLPDPTRSPSCAGSTPRCCRGRSARSPRCTRPGSAGVINQVATAHRSGSVGAAAGPRPDADGDAAERSGGR